MGLRRWLNETRTGRRGIYEEELWNVALKMVVQFEVYEIERGNGYSKLGLIGQSGASRHLVKNLFPRWMPTDKVTWVYEPWRPPDAIIIVEDR